MTSGVNRNYNNRRQMIVGQRPAIEKPTIKNFRNSSMEPGEDRGHSPKIGSTINIQTSTQPTTMSVLHPQMQKNNELSYIQRTKEESITVDDSKSRITKPGGITYNRHNPQNELNNWRSSIVKRKPPSQGGTTNEGTSRDPVPLDLSENPLDTDRSKNTIDVDRPLFIKKFKQNSAKTKRKIIRPGLTSIKSPTSQSNNN